MTVPVGAEPASESRPPTGSDARADPDMPVEPGGRTRLPATAAETVAATCPYLTSAGGAWRSSTPSRDHRCAAVDPPVPQPTDKQRRHCLSSDHVECSMYRAARAARASSLAAGSDPALVAAADERRRPLARTAPILLEPPRLGDQAIRLQLDRGTGQLALVALMVVAFAIVALTRLSAGGTPSAFPSPTLVAAASVPAPSPTPTTATTAPPSASVTPSGSPEPSVRTTYKVKKGDTLLAIAKRFGTTAARIRALNGMTSSALKIGQVLKIP
jgi:LysM repeat protein